MTTLPRVDLVLRGGRIHTFAGEDSASDPVVSALAIRDGRVVAVGTDDDIAPLAEDAARVIDLAGRCVIPGLNDSHIHAVRGGASWNKSLHWDDLRSIDDGIAQIREAAKRQDVGSWISVVGGWHSRQVIEKRVPTRLELDAVAPENPVYVQELYDRAILNSAALTACGWVDDSPDPVRGSLVRDASGRLTGEIHGVGAFSVPLALALQATQADAADGTRTMMREFATHGLTGVVDGGGLAVTPRDYDPVYALWREGGLGVRTRLFISAWTRDGEHADIERLTSVVQPDFGDGMLKVVGIGEIPHLGCHDMEGLDSFEASEQSYRELVGIVRLCAERGWRMIVHAVKDTTLSLILDAWEEVERENGLIAGRRFSIVHADEACEQNLARLAALGGGVLVQDRLVLKATDYLEAWGEQATTSAPPIGTIRRHGMVIGGGSDATRANWFSPWASIWWLVTGRSVDGATPRLVEHRMSRHEAIASYTRDAAWFTGEEGHRGRLEPGYDADLCVPTLDPFSCADAELRDIRSDLTILGGAVTHASPQFAPIADRVPARL